MDSAIESYNLGRLGVIGMKGCEEMTYKINEHLRKFNEEKENHIDSFVIPINCSR